MAFACTQCGLCCTNLADDFVVIAFKADRQRIADNLGRPLTEIEGDLFEINTEFSELAGSPIYQVRSTDGKCTFLGANNLCSIHAFKPFQCRHGPERLFSDTMAKSYDCMIGFENQSDPAIENEFFDQLFNGG